MDAQIAVAQSGRPHGVRAMDRRRPRTVDDLLREWGDYVETCTMRGVYPITPHARLLSKSPPSRGTGDGRPLGIRVPGGAAAQIELVDKALSALRLANTKHDHGPRRAYRVIWWRYVAKRSQEATADELGLTRSAVRKLERFGKQHVARYLCASENKC